MVDPIIEFESLYKNYKVSRIDVNSSNDFFISVDDKKNDDSKFFKISSKCF